MKKVTLPDIERRFGVEITEAGRSGDWLVSDLQGSDEVFADSFAYSSYADEESRDIVVCAGFTSLIVVRKGPGNTRVIDQVVTSPACKPEKLMAALGDIAKDTIPLQARISSINWAW